MSKDKLPAHLHEAQRLLDAGFKLVKLHKNTKQPVGDDWNIAENAIVKIVPDATGYGIPLLANGLCSVDPDNLEASRIGLKALGFELEDIMSLGVRTSSTRPGSGGRSAFKSDDKLTWLRFSGDDIGTVLEFRANSTNLQDCCPGVQYLDKDGNQCEQDYDPFTEHLFDDAPELPQNLLDWWARCSDDAEFFWDQTQKFFAAIGSRPLRAVGHGKKLAFPSGCRQFYNSSHTVEPILERHAYTKHSRKRWAPHTATGSPSVRPIPGRDGLWHSDHASDPLWGNFDAWTAHVMLDHKGDVAAAEQAFNAEFQDATTHSEADLIAEFSVIDEETGEIMVVSEQAKAENNPLPVSDKKLQIKSKEDSLVKAYELVDAAQSVTELLEDIPKKIQNLTGLTAGTCKSIAHRIKVKAKALGSELSVNDIKPLIKTKEMDYVEKTNAQQSFNKSTLATDWIFLEASCEFYNPTNDARVGVRALDIMLQNEMPMDQNGNRKLPSKMFAEFGGKTVFEAMYWPKQYAMGDIFFELHGKRYVNSYRGNNLPATDPDWESKPAWKLCRDHIMNMFADPADGELIIKWLAHNVQFPGEKILWAPVIVGVQGDGKTTLGRMLASAMGEKNIRNINMKEVFSNFSAWGTGHCVGVIEEIRISGHNRADAMDTLKPFITNQTVCVVYKGIDGIDVLNTQNYIAFTNHGDALKLDHGDRRWGVFKTRFIDREEVLVERDKAYWKELYSAILNGGSTIRSWLLAVSLEDFDPMQAPVCNEAKLNMIEAGISDDAANIIEVLSDLEEPVKVVELKHIEKLIRDRRYRSISSKMTGMRLAELGFVKDSLKVDDKKIQVYLTKDFFNFLRAEFGTDEEVETRKKICQKIRDELNFTRTQMNIANAKIFD